MGGIFGVTSKSSCTLDLFFGTDYHSHLGTRRGGMAVYGSQGFHRSIHNIENTPFRTKFDGDLDELEGTSGIGCISDNEPQPLMVQSHLGTFAITTVGKINKMCIRDRSSSLALLPLYQTSLKKQRKKLLKPGKRIFLMNSCCHNIKNHTTICPVCAFNLQFPFIF